MNETMHILPIEPKHIPEVRSLAVEVFGNGTQFLLPKKKMWGFYATLNHEIVGAILLDKAGKEGFVAWIFVSNKARGHKLASKLMAQGDQAFKEKGIQIVFALVRDDNTASWNMFYKMGYKILPFHKTLLKYSLKSFMKRLNYFVVTGYSIWVKDETVSDPIYPKFPILRTLFSSLVIATSVALYGLRSLEFLMIVVSYVLGVTLLRMMVAYPIARLSGPVRFKPSSGGFLLSLILAWLTSLWFPTFGFFVPKEDLWDVRHFKNNIGMQAFATWMVLNIVFVLSAVFLSTIFSQGLGIFLLFVIIYQIFPSFPFDGFDGAKVYRWNRYMYGLGLFMTLASIVSVYVLL